MHKKALIKARLFFFSFCIIGVAVLTFINIFVIKATHRYILPETELYHVDNFDCVLILGCGVRKDGKPTDTLSDRVTVGMRVYESGISDRILMSGDHGRKSYDEVNTMKALAVEAGIPPDNIFCDHAGFSTYESMYRAADIFGARRIVIVTQSSHLPRAIYIARKFCMDAYGVSADERSYSVKKYQQFREFFARVKDFIWCIVRPEPTYRGDKISLSGSGSLTDG